MTIRRPVSIPLLLLLAALAPSGRAAACARSILVTTPSEPQAAAAAPRIVLARAKAASAADEAANRDTFTVEEVLRGDDEGPDLALPGGTTDCDPMIWHQPGKLFLLYLEPRVEGPGWRLSSLYEDGFPIDRPVAGPDDPLVRRVREYARIARAGSGMAAETALRRLREEAAQHPERYPAGLAADLDLHFRFLTPFSPFARLAELYERARHPEERMEALWAMTSAPHPETKEFLRRRLASGEDLGRELGPISSYVSRGGDARDLELLVGAGLRSDLDRYTAPAAALQLAQQQGDDRLVWQVLRARPETLHVFTPWFAEHPPTARRRAELGRLYRRLPDGEKDRLASLLAFGNGDTDPLLLSLVLAGDDPGGRTARLAGRPEALAQAFRAAGSAERRRALLLRLLAGTGKDAVPLVLTLLRDAREGEAEVLLFWLRGRFQLGDAVPPALAAWVADTPSAAEAERALWAGAAATGGNRDFLLPSVRQLAERLPPAVAGGSPAVALLGRAALSCPDEYGRSELWSALVAAAGEADRPLLLDFLRQATGDEGESLAGWFAQHPDPAAIPALKALLDRPGATSLMPGHDGSSVAIALAAAGDPEIVARVSALFARRPVYTAYGLAQVLLRSPLPEAAEAARRLLPQAAPGPG